MSFRGGVARAGRTADTRKMRVMWSTVRFVAVASVLAGCGMVSGLDSLTVSPEVPDDGGSSGTSGSTSGTSGTSSGTSGTSGASGTSGTSGTSGDSGSRDTGSDAPATGCSSQQDCVPPIPAGWTPVWFSSFSRPPCPGSSPTPKLRATAPPSHQLCQSGCAPSVDTCGTGTYPVGLGGATCTTASFNTSPTQNCTALVAGVAVGAATTVKVTPPAGPPACNAQPATPVPA